MGQIPDSTTSIKPAWRRAWPGFRTGVWWKKVSASVGYVLIGFFLLGFATTGYFSLLATAGAGVLFTLLIGNLGGARSRAPLIGSASRVSAAIGWAAVVALTFSGVLVAGALDAPRTEADRARQAGVAAQRSSEIAVARTGSPTRTSEPVAQSSSPTATPSAPPTPAREPADVVSVTDGDTIRVSLQGRTLSLRYIGIDTPETVDPARSVEPYGREATEANRRLVEGRTVFLEKDVSETDGFGRLLRYVYVESATGLLMVNAELVKLGYARVATFPPDVRYQSVFLDLERQARTQNAGLWAPSPSPVTAATTAAPTLSAAPTTQLRPPTTAQPATTAPQTAAPAPAAPVQTAAPPPTSAAAGSIVITRLFYDGVVPTAESDEYVEIQNNGSGAQSMSGWRIFSANGGQTYSFPAISIAPGQTCRVYTNQVHPDWCGLSWGRGSAVWNNDGDRAELLNPSGAVISKFGYGGW